MIIRYVKKTSCMSYISFFWLLLITIALLVCGGVIIWGFLHDRAFTAMPIARNTVMNNMDGLVIVLDTRNRIMDFNRTAQKTLDLSPSTIGKTPASLARPGSDLFQTYAETTECKNELILDAVSSQVIYELTISP